MSKKPNVVFVFGDQWRRQATGYAGDPNVKTPNLDALARESVNFTHALSGCPVCSPYRASVLTGQRPLTHGVFVNDVYLQPRATSMAQAFSSAGYDTAYIGKWHVDGHGRSSYIPPERRLGFDYWKVLECTHDYNHSPYYAGTSDEKRFWNGYDAIAQTRDVETYIRNHAEDKPFLLMLSWGPPHAPYETAPEEFRKLYHAEPIELLPNVPDEIAAQAREWLAGYYAHCSAMDSCVGDLLTTIQECGIEDDTIFVFTSDHGDMLGSQGETKKQRPWDESIRVPFLLKYPGLSGWRPRETDALIDAPDIVPTLLGLCGIPIS
ncbi:MAG: sulfatase, partial [Spirochaetaceae bacterium]|nr:sulfatase [Spirochaetaceae bacterium]